MLHLRSKLYLERSKLEAGLQAYERANLEAGTIKEEIYGSRKESSSH